MAQARRAKRITCSSRVGCKVANYLRIWAALRKLTANGAVTEAAQDPARVCTHSWKTRVPSAAEHHGLVVTSRSDLRDFQKPFAQDRGPVSTFVDAIKTLKPTGIIGVSTVPKLFNRQVIEAMSQINERPIIFPYSNPTSRSECTAEEAYNWSDGRAVFASGSPFPPIEIAGRKFVPGQGNNVYIFPAMGMAVFATESTRVTQEMFIVAAKAVAEQVSEESLAMGLIYPPQSRILEASLHVARRIAEYIFDKQLARVPRPDDIQAHIRACAYRPVYLP